MSVLSFCDPTVRRFVKAHRSVRNARVLKLTADQSAVTHLTDVRAPRGPHQPTVYQHIGVIGTTYTVGVARDRAPAARAA